MKLSDNGINRASFLVSIGVHIAILMIAVPVDKITVKIEQKPYQIPVQMQITKAPPPSKKETKPTIKKVITEKKVAKAPAKIETVEKPQEPTRLPGDRDNPEIAETFTPVYPKTALNNNWSGQIIVLATINENGEPVAIEIKKSTGYDLLDETFVRTVKHYYRFKPKRVLGKDVIGKKELNYTFILDES
ncbi:energy transducer TonB [Thermoproteota archaeon]